MPTLQEKHIKNCRLIESKHKLLHYLPKNAVCAEVGILVSNYSQKILEITQPQTLHLFDNQQYSIDIATSKFAKQLKQGTVALHYGDSSTNIKTLDDGYFDWVYIDGNHSYEGCKKDLWAIYPKMKPGGLIALNDYIYFSALELSKYGVVEAVNEFCLAYNYEIIYMTLHPRMYNDVVLKPIV